MRTKLFKKSDLPTKPWKNGRGKTVELAISPEKADFTRDPFVWRLSSAEVNEAGPFSKFAGYDRFLTLMSGKPLKLKLKTGEQQVAAGEVARFSGDDEVEALTPVGPVTDLNLIVKRGVAKGELHALKIAKNPRSFQVEGETAFIVGIEGNLKVEVFPGEVKFKLQAGDIVRIDRDNAEEDIVVLIEPAKEKAKGLVGFAELSTLLSGAPAQKPW